MKLASVVKCSVIERISGKNVSLSDVLPVVKFSSTEILGSSGLIPQLLWQCTVLITLIYKHLTNILIIKPILVEKLESHRDCNLCVVQSVGIFTITFTTFP